MTTTETQTTNWTGESAARTTTEQEVGFLADAVPVGVFRTDAAGDVMFANARWTHLLDNARHLEQVFTSLHDEDRPRLRQVCGTAIQSGAMSTTRVRMGDGRRHLEFRLQGISTAVDGPCDHGLIGTVEDVTAAVALAYELEARVELDPVTGLANRRALRRTLDAAVTASRSALVVFGGLDDFRSGDDDCIHLDGDELLTAIGRRLLETVRPGDVVGRWGGAEFLVVCLDVPAGHEEDVVQRFDHALERPIRVGDRDHRALVPLRIARPRPGEDIDAVLRRANWGMYEPKHLRTSRA